jgi:cytoskeleton protein RodZ
MAHILTDDIGGRLRSAREQRCWSLPDVAKRTKLSVDVLRAIERNDFASLPGGMFRKAYVRMLAVEVGLDPNELAADYCTQFEPPIEPAVQDRQRGVEEKQRGVEEKLIAQLAPSPRRSFVTVAALAGVAAAWFLLRPGPVAPVMPSDDATSELVAVRTPAADASGLISGLAATPTAVVAPAAAVPLRIEMAATGWCWVAAETDGQRVMYRLVAPGERVVLEGQHLISLRLGNAGSVTLSINDGARRSPGRLGEVVELEVTPDNVEGLRNAAAATVSGD